MFTLSYLFKVFDSINMSGINGAFMSKSWLGLTKQAEGMETTIPELGSFK